MGEGGVLGLFASQLGTGPDVVIGVSFVRTDAVFMSGFDFSLSITASFPASFSPSLFFSFIGSVFVSSICCFSSFCTIVCSIFSKVF